MHRKIVTTLLTIHVLFMMLVVSYNSKFDITSRGMIVVGILALYIAILFFYVRKKVLYQLVMLETILYFIVNISVFSFYIIGSFSSLAKRDIMIFSFVFIPGIYSSVTYAVFLINDRRKKEVVA